MSDLNEINSMDWNVEARTRRPDSQLQKVLKSISEFATVSEILRTSGAMIIVASMSLFLIQGFNVAADVQRYGMLLLQTLLLTAGGFALSYLLKENKGARIFYALALISIPVNFTVLGALTFSLTEAQTHTLPSFASWVVTDVNTMLITAIISAGILLPLTWFCLRIFARGSESTLSLGLLASCFTLLIPTRDVIFVGPLAIAGVLALIWMFKSIRKSNPLTAGSQNWFVKCVLFAPTLILIVRSGFLYQFDALVALTLATTAFLITRHVSSQLATESLLRKCLEFIGAPIAVAMGIALFELLQPYGHESAVTLISIAVTVELIFEIAFRAGTVSMSRILSTLSMMIMGLTLVELTMFNAGLDILAASVLLLAMATFLMARTRRGAESIIGGLSIAVILTPHLFELIEAIQLSNWIVLSIIGAVAVVGGSVLDRHGARIKLRMENWIYQSRSVDTP